MDIDCDLIIELRQAQRMEGWKDDGDTQERDRRNRKIRSNIVKGEQTSQMRKNKSK